MGCSQSKEEVVATVPPRETAKATATSSEGTAPLSKSSAYSATLVSKATAIPKPKVNFARGYSSGASSYEGSEFDGDVIDDGNLSGRGVGIDASTHSDLLGIQSLREELRNEGDFTKTVVRIETPFGKPIEEIYDGVHDGPVLGSGVSGIVRLVVHKTTAVKYAVKCLDIGLIDSAEGLQALRNEIAIMCQLDYPSIVRIEEVYESTNEIYIVQELCLGGDLFDRLDEQADYHYTEAQCARLVKQMLSSIRYLHSKDIIHRDLKLENFLFSSTSPDSELKMIDFGLSKHFAVGQQLSDRVGTPYCVAPEIVLGDYNEKVDLWALGVITYLLLSGETPFGGLDGEDLFTVKQRIMKAEVVFEPADVWDGVSDEAKAFVHRLLDLDSDRRPTAKRAQRDPWIQIWAKKDAKAGKNLSRKTINALMDFKEQSDMQKLLSEVLSFTLLPEQIVDLRHEFEKIDSDGDGEISLSSMKKILMDNAEAGTLGAFTEEEIDALFDAIRVRKDEPTIRWHEFLAAGLSNAKVDERNLRLAFDRIDADRRGYIVFEDLQDLLGNSTESDALEQIWADSLKECRVNNNRIKFEDFKRLMKGQPKDKSQMPVPPVLVGPSASQTRFNSMSHVLLSVPEEKSERTYDDSLPEQHHPERKSNKTRSRSFELKSSAWPDQDLNNSFSDLGGRSMTILGDSETMVDQNMSPLLVNRAIYRKHREMRLAVLDASKQFDKKRHNRTPSRDDMAKMASLIMKRGEKTPMDMEDAHNQAMFDAATKRSGRSRRTRNKTVSDVSGMMIKSQV